MRIATILHGAYGDVYEQALSIRLLKKNSVSNNQYIAFFARADRLAAFLHFQLDMFDECYPIEDIETVPVDQFFQYQIHDGELVADVMNKLSPVLLEKFDRQTNYLPWKTLKRHTYTQSPLSLVLSDTGQAHYESLLDKHDLQTKYRSSKISIGYLWRYRSKQGAVKPYFQKDKNWILESKSALFNELIKQHDAHVVVAGMNVAQDSMELDQYKEKAGVLQGEITAKFASEKLDIPDENVTYLCGDGYAAEMEIIANTDIQIVMPSGFSEPLWMRNTKNTVLVDPPPVYLMKLLKYRMPLFDNRKFSTFKYNNLTTHSASAVLRELHRRSLL